MSAKTVEEMRKELEAAGYKINPSTYSDKSHVQAPDGWLYFLRDGDYQAPDDIYGGDVHEFSAKLQALREQALTERAYQHFQQQKQHEAMRELLEELANNQWDAKTRDGYPETSRAANALDNLRHKAKKLLESMKG